MEAKVVPLFVRRMAEQHGLAREELSFKELVNHALVYLACIGPQAEIVCGPITTGGFGHPGYNVLLFNHAIDLLKIEGRPMFNQVPYEYQLARLESEWKKEHGHDVYCHPILTEFYQPLFESKSFTRAWFLPGWKASTGASWEHATLLSVGCMIEYLPNDWIYDLHGATLRM